MAASFLQTIWMFGVDAAKATGVHVFAQSEDIDQAASVVRVEDSYAQLATQSKVEILSSSALDITQSVTIIGVDDGGRRATETVALDTTDGTTVVTSVKTWRYIENCYLNMECAGTVTIQHVDNTDVNIIPIGKISADVVQHFSGDDNECLVLGWWAGIAFDEDIGVWFELRWYPSDADCLDAGDGYRLLDRIDLDVDATGANIGNIQRTFPAPIHLPAGGWLCVYGDAEADDTVGYAGMQVVDVPTVGALPIPANITSS